MLVARAEMKKPPTRGVSVPRVLGRPIVTLMTEQSGIIHGVHDCKISSVLLKINLHIVNYVQVVVKQLVNS